MCNKITADMLTEEYGFVDGVVVMYQCHVGKVGDYAGGCNFFDNDDVDFIDDLMWAFNDCKGVIKILTGPMSIWNHAPEWAEKVCVMRDSIHWCFKDTLMFGAEESQYTNRPWWAQNA